MDCSESRFGVSTLKVSDIGTGFMPARGTVSGGDEPRPYEKNDLERRCHILLTT